MSQAPLLPTITLQDVLADPASVPVPRISTAQELVISAYRARRIGPDERDRVLRALAEVLAGWKAAHAAAAPDPIAPELPHIPPKPPQARVGSLPRSNASLWRRRTRGRNSWLPDQDRGLYTQGEEAVLAVIGREIAEKGKCTLYQDAIAAMAGVSTRLVRYALYKAVRLGLVVSRVRKLSAWRNSSNVITPACARWAKWLRRRTSALRGWLARQLGTTVPGTGRKAEANPVDLHIGAALPRGSIIVRPPPLAL